MTSIDKLIGEIRDRQALPPPAVRRQIRKRAGASLAAFGETLGVSAQAVANWETGAREPRPAALRAYRELLERVQAETQ